MTETGEIIPPSDLLRFKSELYDCPSMVTVDRVVKELVELAYLTGCADEAGKHTEQT